MKKRFFEVLIPILILLTFVIFLAIITIMMLLSPLLIIIYIISGINTYKIMINLHSDILDYIYPNNKVF